MVNFKCWFLWDSPLTFILLIHPFAKTTSIHFFAEDIPDENKGPRLQEFIVNRGRSFKWIKLKQRSLVCLFCEHQTMGVFILGFP